MITEQHALSSLLPFQVLRYREGSVVDSDLVPNQIDLPIIEIALMAIVKERAVPEVPAPILSRFYLVRNAEARAFGGVDVIDNMYNVADVLIAQPKNVYFRTRGLAPTPRPTRICIQDYQVNWWLENVHVSELANLVGRISQPDVISGVPDSLMKVQYSVGLGAVRSMVLPISRWLDLLADLIELTVTWLSREVNQG